MFSFLFSFLFLFRSSPSTFIIERPIFLKLIGIVCKSRRPPYFSLDAESVLVFLIGVEKKSDGWLDDANNGCFNGVFSVSGPGVKDFFVSSNGCVVLGIVLMVLIVLLILSPVNFGFSVLDVSLCSENFTGGGGVVVGASVVGASVVVLMSKYMVGAWM